MDIVFDQPKAEVQFLVHFPLLLRGKQNVGLQQSQVIAHGPMAAKLQGNQPQVQLDEGHGPRYLVMKKCTPPP